MNTALVKRDAKGRWEPGTPSPGGGVPQTTARLWRNLLREPVGVRDDGSPCLKQDGTPYTRAEALFDVVFRRAMDDDRKDAVLWAKLLVDRAEGPARPDADDSLGLPAIMKDAHERWLRKSATPTSDSDAPPPATDQSA